MTIKLASIVVGTRLGSVRSQDCWRALGGGGAKAARGSKERKNLWMMKGILGAIPNIAKNNYLEGWAVHKHSGRHPGRHPHILIIPFK